MKNKLTVQTIFFAVILFFAFYAFAEQEKVIQIFRDGKIIQEYAVSDIDYIEVNNKLVVPETIPDDEIWYVTADGTTYDVTALPLIWGVQPFDRTVVSNEYYGDHGVIKLDGPVKRISERTFSLTYPKNILAVYLPDCVEEIGAQAFGDAGLTTFRVPKSLRTVESTPFINCPDLRQFTGSHVSADGRCIVLEDCIKAFAPAGINTYITPDGIKSIGSEAFYGCNELEEIKFSEGLENIKTSAFARCLNLKSVTFPSTLEDMHTYAFRECPTIEGFYGNERFHTSDHQCLITMIDYPWLPPEWNGPWIIGFAGKGLSEYFIPEGIVVMENYAFSDKMELKKVTIPNSMAHVDGLAFHNCPNIESVEGYHVSSDNKCIVFDGELQAFVGRKDIKSYHIPNEVTKIGINAFAECGLEEVNMEDNVTDIGGYAFSECRSLKSLTLSASLKSFGGYNPVFNSPELETVYMRAPLPPTYEDTQMSEFPNLKIYVPEDSYELYMNSPQWEQFKPFFAKHHYDDLDPERYLPDYYYSTDYSRNGNVEQLMEAREGKGIDIVLMGDGFSDRQIADGSYRKVMVDMADNLFAEEPYSTFKDLFNVYVVDVVSPVEGYEHGATALGGFFGGGTYVGGNDATCFKYAQKAISDDRMDEALIVVAMNRDAYAGTCFMYYPNDITDGFGNGVSVAYFPTSSDKETFYGLLQHEAMGHGFAKLADEYAYEGTGSIPTEMVNETQRQQTLWGWSRNVDFTPSLSDIRWNKFITDPRYLNENIGAYEGGMTYWTGVWRPTENSIMRYNVGGFNAPSREAIYNRIHKLAYGNEWEYDYEEFTNYDAKNLTQEAVGRRKAQQSGVRIEKQHTPPVIVKKNWREAMNEPSELPNKAISNRR